MRRAGVFIFVYVLLGALLHNTAICAPVYPGVVDPFRAYSYEDMLSDAEALRELYPGLIRLGSIGRSVEGRELLLLELGNGSRRIFLDGTMHASEYISTSYLMYMVEHYSQAYMTTGVYNGFDVKEILSKVTFCIVPMVNPDGVNLVQNGIGAVQDDTSVSRIAGSDARFAGYSCWKANIRGIDLNRNFDNNWYVERPVASPAARLFKGYYPVSEPETQAVENYVNANMCWAFVNFHTQGEGVFGWDDKNVGYYPQLKDIVTRILASSGFRRLTDTLDSDYGTFAGYTRETFLKPTLTIELCKYIGCAPYPDAEFMSVWSPAQDICLIVADEVLKMGAQEFIVLQDGVLRQAFCDASYAYKYAASIENASVLYVKSGPEALQACERMTAQVQLDGTDVAFQAYTLGGSSYFKLRDLAMALKGTGRQFAVDYDAAAGSVILTSGQPYTPVGGELTWSGDTADVTAIPSQSAVYLDGLEISLSAYAISGYNYFRLRDIGKALNFGVIWEDAANTIIIETTTEYID